MPPSSPAQISQALDVWFCRDGKDYPWRRTTDAYAILVSEMMLQQTQIRTVLDRGYYERWMNRFPDLATLAKADETEVLRTWEGLGYYRRARFLHRLSQVIMQEHEGVFPTDEAALRKLPGIGAYTAGALMSFAYDAPFPLVDGNVARVLARLYNDATPVDSTVGQKLLWQRAADLMHHAVSPRRHNSALMELGQSICKTTQPHCAICPVQSWCLVENPASLPVKNKRTEITEIEEQVYFFLTNESVLLEQETGRRRTGLWKLPALPPIAAPTTMLHRMQYTITRYRVTLSVHEVSPASLPEVIAAPLALIPLAELPALPIPSPYRKALNALLARTTLQPE